MEINKLSENHKEFEFGICVTESKVYQKKFKNVGLIYTVCKGSLVKIIEYNQNHVVLTRIPDEFTLSLPNSLLTTPNHTHFNLIELKLFKYLNAINDIDERFEFYQNAERREFVLGLEKNNIVNIVCSHRLFKAVFVEVEEKNLKMFTTVKLLVTPPKSTSLLKNLNATDFSTNNIYSPSANVIRNLNFTDQDLQMEQNLKTKKFDKNLWECHSCHRENVKKAKYCPRCLTPNNNLDVYPREVHIDKIDAPKISHIPVEDSKFVKPKNYQPSKNSDLNNKYKGLRSTNSAQNNSSPSSINMGQLSKPLKTFTVAPVNLNENQTTIYVELDERKNAKPNGKGIINQKNSSVKTRTIMRPDVVPDINPNVAAFVIDSRWTLPSCVPAAILRKIKKTLEIHPDIGNTSRQGNYKLFELPPVHYDEKTAEEISQPPLNVTISNNAHLVPDAILQFSLLRIENSSATGNYKPFALPTVQYNVETDEEISQPHMTLLDDGPAASSLQANYRPFKLPTEPYEEPRSKIISLDFKEKPTANLPQKVIDGNKTKPNLNLSNKNNASLCLICRGSSSNVIELDCLHVFCPKCLMHGFSGVDNMYCPFRRGNYKCNFKLDIGDFKKLLEMCNKLY